MGQQILTVPFKARRKESWSLNLPKSAAAGKDAKSGPPAG